MRPPRGRSRARRRGDDGDQIERRRRTCCAGFGPRSGCGVRLPIPDAERVGAVSKPVADRPWHPRHVAREKPPPTQPLATIDLARGFPTHSGLPVYGRPWGR